MMVLFRGDHERITLFDIDGDGRQELITAIRRGSPRGTLVVSLQEGDDLVHNSGGGFETWVTEFQTNSNTYGGGSPYHALPADLNGDGNYEVVNHHWNYFNLYNFSSTGPDTYVIADSGLSLIHI